MEFCHTVQVGSCHFHLTCNSFVVDSFVPLRYCYWLNCLLSLAGDVALNPGLARFPCTVCTHPVCDDQCGIQCDGCMEWTHAGCVNVSVDFYNQMEAKVEFSWHCPLCLFQELPLLDVLDGSVSSSSPDSENLAEDPSTIDLLEATISGVRIVHHNVQGIQSKIIELTQCFEVCGGTATIFCFTETWLKPCLPTLTVPGYTVLTSPFLRRPGRDSGYLPGSRIIVSNSMTIERSFVCEHLEKSCQLLNLVCRFINCH